MFLQKTIIKIVSEIFENPKIPDNLEEISFGFYKFSIENTSYGIIFEPFFKVGSIMVPDAKLKSLIEKQKNNFSFKFGILNESNQIIDGIKTNNFNSISVFNFIIAISDKFIKENNVDVLSYFANDNKRKNIYKNICLKFLKNNYIYYSPGEKTGYNAFYIRKDLFEKNELNEQRST